MFEIELQIGVPLRNGKLKRKITLACSGGLSNNKTNLQLIELDKRVGLLITSHNSRRRIRDIPIIYMHIRPK